MATQTVTTTQSQTIQTSQLIHLVGSEDITLPPPKRSSSFGPYCSANGESPLYPIPIVDSFDAPCDSSVWKTQLPTNTSKIRQWVERRYYQHEVTWGLYMLTAGEKVVIHSLVLIMFSLISYTLTNIAILQQGVRMIVSGVSAVVGVTYSAAAIVWLGCMLCSADCLGRTRKCSLDLTIRWRFSNC